MYVCLCQKVTDRAIRSSVQQGASSLNDLRQQLGVANRCGRCANMAEALIDEAQAQNNNLLPYAIA